MSLHPLPIAGIALLAVAATGCASGPPANPATIVPYEGGLIVASAASRSEEGAMRSAVRGAEMACDDRGGQLAVIKTTTVYRGMVAKEVNDTLSKVGAIINAQGDEAATVPDLSSPEDYKAMVEFRCEKPKG